MASVFLKLCTQKVDTSWIKLCNIVIILIRLYWVILTEVILPYQNDRRPIFHRAAQRVNVSKKFIIWHCDDYDIKTG